MGRSMGGVFLCCVVVFSLFPLDATADDREEVRYLKSIDIAKGQETGDVICIGCSVKIAGTAHGDAIALGGDLEISGTVAGDAVVVGGTIRLLEGAAVDGEATVVGGALVRQGRAAVRGGEDVLPYFYVPGQRSIHFRGALLLLGSGVLLGLLGALLVRSRRGENMRDALMQHPVISVALGIVAFAGWILLWMALASAGRLAAEAAWIGIAAGLFLFLWGGAGLAWIAGRLASVERPPILTFLSGGAIWAVVMLVPLAGTLALLAALVLSLGVSLAAGLGAGPHWFFRTILRRKASSS